MCVVDIVVVRYFSFYFAFSICHFVTVTFVYSPFIYALFSAVVIVVVYVFMFRTPHIECATGSTICDQLGRRVQSKTAHTHTFYICKLKQSKANTKKNIMKQTAYIWKAIKDTCIIYIARNLFFRPFYSAQLSLVQILVDCFAFCRIFFFACLHFMSMILFANGSRVLNRLCYGAHLNTHTHTHIYGIAFSDVKSMRDFSLKSVEKIIHVELEINYKKKRSENP